MHRQDLGRLSEEELTWYRRDTVAFVWQGTARNLVPYLNLRENVGLPLLAKGQAEWTRKRTDELLEAVATTPTVRAAAEQLHVSRSNVYASLRRIARKLGVKTVPELVTIARQGGLPDQPAS